MLNLVKFRCQKPKTWRTTFIWTTFIWGRGVFSLKNRFLCCLNSFIQNCRYVLAKLSKFFEISMQTSSVSLLQGILWKLERAGTSLQEKFFIWFFDQKNCFIILHKLVRCHYQTVYFSIYAIKCVSCFMLRHWWRYEIWISEKLNISIMTRPFEVKWNTFFFVSQVLSFRLPKQTSKNVTDTTFKWP